MDSGQQQRYALLCPCNSTGLCVASALHLRCALSCVDGLASALRTALRSALPLRCLLRALPLPPRLL